MDIQTYYINHFTNDTSILRHHGISCLCGRIWNSIYGEKLDLKLVHVKYFAICSYELNLIDQILYSNTNFSKIHAIWKDTMPEFISCRCIYMSHPSEVLRYAKIHASKKGRPILFSQADLLEADKFFLNQITANPELNISVDELKSAIVNDPDCSVDILLKIIKD